MPTCFICKQKIVGKYYQDSRCNHNTKIIYRHNTSEVKECEEKWNEIASERYYTGYCATCNKRLKWYFYEKVIATSGTIGALCVVGNTLGSMSHPNASNIKQILIGLGYLAIGGVAGIGTFMGFMLYSMWNMDVVDDEKEDKDE
jgi:hypothetical protein